MKWICIDIIFFKKDPFKCLGSLNYRKKMNKMRENETKKLFQSI